MRLTLISFLLFVMCSCHRIHEGTVANKYMVPAHEYSYATVIMVGKVPITTWHTAYVDDEYVLVISGRDGKRVITEEFSVSYETFECKQIGDYFNDTIKCEIYKQK